jgi:hypothetical protein
VVGPCNAALAGGDRESAAIPGVQQFQVQVIPDVRQVFAGLESYGPGSLRAEAEGAEHEHHSPARGNQELRSPFAAEKKGRDVVMLAAAEVKQERSAAEQKKDDARSTAAAGVYRGSRRSSARS